MQRDPNEMSNRSPGSEERGAREGMSGAGASEQFGASTSGAPGERSSSAFSDVSGTLGRESLGGGTSKLEQTREGAREKLGQVKEKATTLKATLADKLDAGAERIRQRSAKTSVTEAGAEAEERMRKTGSKVASGMESTADWIRNADVNSVRSGIEEQVRTSPGRTLLVALGLGYLVGRVMRGGRRG